MRKRTFIKISAGLVALSGVALLVYVLFPIISYEFADSIRFTSTLSPIPGGQAAASASQKNIDYTKASNWFADGKERDFSNSQIGYYRLSIPKLNIKDATVAIGGEDLADSLIQYPGTAVPGKRGNAVIFGHSILPQFYNPKNYLSIFSKLPTLKKDDEIFVEYDGVSYKYKVEEMFEVLPADLQVLEQDSSDSFLTLVTCTPPGHPLRPKRLIVRARVVPLNAQSKN